MADKTIGELPSVANVSDAALIPVEQAGVASKMTGAQFKAWAVDNAAEYTAAAEAAADSAEDSATAAGASQSAAAASASAAEASRQAIEDLGVTSTTLDPGSSATVSKIVNQSGSVTLRFGIPQGAKGDQGATGPTGATGAQGPQGISGLAVPSDSQYAFTVESGHLICTYTGNTAPDFSIDENGHLILEIEE